MKHRILHIFYTLSATLCLLLSLTGCQQHTYRIAVSQCFHNDWNLQVVRDLQREANSNPEIDLHIELCTEGVTGQQADVRRFIAEGYDLIIIAPDEAEGLSPVVNEAAIAGIPVILIDSETSSSNYTARVCGDNINIGERCGQFAVYSLNGRGKVIELRGVEGSSACQKRHQGFANVLKYYPDIQIIDSCYCDWTYENALPLIDSLLTLHPDVDLIAAQCDPMALAAYDACILHDFERLPFITGVDGLMGENNGINNVLEGKLSATCTNPTGALEAIRLALDILEGRPYQRITMLPTQLIDQHSASLFVSQEERVNKLNRRIEEVNGQLGHYFQRTNLLQVFIITLILVLLLIIGFTIYIWRSVRQRNALRLKVQNATQDKLRFFTSVSHSFRTPITLIADPIRTLQREGGLNERQQQMVDLMAHQSDELLRLVDQVLNVLQSDLIKDGTRLDAIAQTTTHPTPSLEQMRDRLLTVDPEPTNEPHRKTLLIIDDNPDIRHYLGLVLEARNYFVLTAPNGEEGLLVARHNVPDLIICDVMMPIMDGLECCRLLKADQATSHIPVLMLTAYGLDDQRIQGYQVGADAYITKPFNTDVLCARVVNLIENRKLIDASKDRHEELAKGEFSSVDRNFVNHLHSFVTEHLSDLDLDIQQLSDEFNMSRVQLYRKCKSITGQSPIELIRIIRLKAATRFLETTDMTVSEIAYEVGFSSPSYFAKCYKDQYNESPTDVQRRAREKQGSVLTGNNRVFCKS